MYTRTRLALHFISDVCCYWTVCVTSLLSLVLGLGPHQIPAPSLFSGLAILLHEGIDSAPGKLEQKMFWFLIDVTVQKDNDNQKSIARIIKPSPTPAKKKKERQSYDICHYLGQKSWCVGVHKVKYNGNTVVKIEHI